MVQPRALIFGMRGQDGSYLAQNLVNRGYDVHGTTRDSSKPFQSLDTLGIAGSVTVHGVQMSDPSSMGAVISRVDPQEIYHLAGQSSVGQSFVAPAETIVSHTGGILAILEHMRVTGSAARLFHASSCEVFGEASEPANEGTPFHPLSPYGTAKASSYWILDCYRRAYGLYACAGFLSAHESPLRPDLFVTPRIVAAAMRIAAGSGETLRLADLSIVRDWGWAPDYVDAMWRMLQPETPADFVIATGRSYRLQDLVAHIFAAAGLNWCDHVVNDPSLVRPAEAHIMKADPQAIRLALGWQATCFMPEIAKALVDAEQTGKTKPDLS